MQTFLFQAVCLKKQDTLVYSVPPDIDVSLFAIFTIFFSHESSGSPQKLQKLKTFV